MRSHTNRANTMKTKEYAKETNACKAELKKDKSLLESDMEGGLLRVRITNKCTGKCRYCGLLSWSEEERRQSMDSKWLYDYLEPLYEKVDELLITGGDPFVAPESYGYMRYLSDNYPQTTIITESNGLPFGKEIRSYPQTVAGQIHCGGE